MKRRFAIAVALLVVAAACAQKAPARTGRDRVIIGVLGTFSGGNAGLAAGIARGVELAIDEYNQSRDSNFEARAKRFDTRGSVEGSIDAAKRITTTELLIGVVGPFRLEEAAAAGPVLDAAGIPFLVPSISDVSLAKFGWRNLRRLIADDRQAGGALGDETRRMLNRQAGKIVVFSDGTPAGVAFADGAKGAVEAAKGQVGRFEAAGPKVDYKVVASDLMKEQPAAVIHAGGGGRAGALVASLRNAGFKGLFLASDQARDPSFAKAAGAAAGGSITASPFADPSDRGLAAFRNAHRGKYVDAPAPYVAEAYEGAMMLLEAVQEVEPKPAEVAGFFRTARAFLGDTKLYQYAEDGGLQTDSIWLHEFRDGRWRLLRREDLNAGPRGGYKSQAKPEGSRKEAS